MNPKRPTLRYITTMSKVKDKETIFCFFYNFFFFFFLGDNLKCRNKKTFYTQGNPYKTIRLLSRHCVGQKKWHNIFKMLKRKNFSIKNTPPNQIIIQNRRRNKLFQTEKILKFITLDQPYQFSRSVMSDSLQPHEQEHARPPCPSPTRGVYPNPC